MDPLLLARIQFAANITLHILFPTIPVALGWALLHFKLQHNRWARRHGLAFTAPTPWLQAYHFWVKVFALTFALGAGCACRSLIPSCVRTSSVRR